VLICSMNDCGDLRRIGSPTPDRTHRRPRDREARVDHYDSFGDWRSIKWYIHREPKFTRALNEEENRRMLQERARCTMSENWRRELEQDCSEPRPASRGGAK
jgi:hypothetical protein